MSAYIYGVAVRPISDFAAVHGAFTARQRGVRTTTISIFVEVQFVVVRGRGLGRRGDYLPGSKFSCSGVGWKARGRRQGIDVEIYHTVCWQTALVST